MMLCSVILIGQSLKLFGNWILIKMADLSRGFEFVLEDIERGLRQVH